MWVEWAGWKLYKCAQCGRTHARTPHSLSHLRRRHAQREGNGRGTSLSCIGRGRLQEGLRARRGGARFVERAHVRLVCVGKKGEDGAAFSTLCDGLDVSFHVGGRGGGVRDAQDSAPQKRKKRGFVFVENEFSSLISSLSLFPSLSLAHI